MRISAIRTYAPMVGERPQCLVKVETDRGIVGWGESGLSGREEAVAAAVSHYANLLIGADPMARGRIWQRLYRSQYFEGGRVLTAAQAAIDLALHDIAGKALGVPVYQLLGGRQRNHVPLFATTQASTGPDLVRDGLMLVSAGWDAIRFSPGMPAGADDDVFEPRASLAITAEWAMALREAVGTAPTIGLDYHHRLSVAEAASFCHRLAPGTLDFLEEPIRAEDPNAYAQLRRLIDVPLAIGEEGSSKWQLLPLIERGLTEFVRVDVCNVGGLTEAVKVAGAAEAHYLDLMPHNPLGPIATAATGHLCVAIPNVAWMEIRLSPTEDPGFYDRTMFPVQHVIDGPRLMVSDAPGLGIEVDEERVAAADRRPWDPPALQRRDGSVQNW